MDIGLPETDLCVTIKTAVSDAKAQHVRKTWQMEVPLQKNDIMWRQNSDNSLATTGVQQAVR